MIVQGLQSRKVVPRKKKIELLLQQNRRENGNELFASLVRMSINCGQFGGTRREEQLYTKKGQQ